MKDSKVGWCHHTFNPWWGCVEVSPACDFCYARTLALRFGWKVWGKDAPRRFFGDAHWDAPLRWNDAAEASGVRERMFVASMCDWGEERDDATGVEMGRERERLWRLVERLTAIDTLLLTKRPNAYRRLVPPEILARPSVWPGVTVERQAETWRLDELVRVPCAGPRWVSHEPALEPTDFRAWLPGFGLPYRSTLGLGWIVLGVESRGPNVGRGAAGYDERAWAVIEVARTAHVPVFHKQRPVGQRVSHDPSEWPAALRVQDFPR